MTEIGSMHPSFFETRDSITKFLFLEDEPAPVDLCFVLGSPSISSIVPAVELYRLRMTPKIMISGSAHLPGQRPECEIYREFAIGHGVPAQDILTEPKATNTLENFTLSFPIIEREFGWRNMKTIAIAAKPFHMRRALMTARFNWPPHLNYLMRPSNAEDDAPATTWWKTKSGRRFVLSELRAIGTYALAGQIGGF